MFSAKLSRAAAVFSLLCLAILALMAGQPYFTNSSQPARGMSNPMIALQTVRDVAEVDYVLSDAPSSDREVMRIKIHESFGLTTALTALFLVLGWMSIRDDGMGRLTGIAAMACAAAMAAFDVMEKLAMRRLLDLRLAETPAALLNSIRSASAASWSLTAFALALLAGMFFRGGRWRKIAGVLALLTAVMELYGLRDNRFLEWQIYPAIAALVIVTLNLWGRSKPKGRPLPSTKIDAA